MRESGYKLGREIQDTKVAGRNDSLRNARIETYFPAIDLLVEQGYTVVRIGDPTMTPLVHPGVFDLATSPKRTEELDLYCLMRSDFLLGCESGPDVVVLLTNTPSLIVNATDPISSYPLREKDLFILKRVVNRESEQGLTLEEMLESDYLANLRDGEKFEYIDNTDDEILHAVEEMLDTLKRGVHETPLQHEYREMTLGAAQRLMGELSYIRKWGPDGDFIGDGRIATFFAERSLRQGQPAMVTSLA